MAMTTPLAALMPSDVAPWATALSAYSICTSFPLGLKVVKENEYCAQHLGSGGAAFVVGLEDQTSCCNKETV